MQLMDPILNFTVLDPDRGNKIERVNLFQNYNLFSLFPILAKSYFILQIHINSIPLLWVGGHGI